MEYESMIVSPDNGVSWETIPGYYVDVRAFAAQGKFLFAGTNAFGVLFSRDNGLSWSRASTGLPQWDSFLYVNVPSVQILNDLIFVGTVGHGIWRRPLSDFLPVRPERGKARPALDGGKVHAHINGTSLTYTLQSRSFVQLSIHTLAGKQVAMIGQEYRPAGRHTLKWDHTMMPSGLCLFRFRAGEYVKSGFLMKAR